MSIYTKKFLKTESAIADTIQTDDEIGNDLKQIENDIMGKDGLEAHRDELEYADDPMVGDPVDEAYMSMYEAEFNYNQLMKCIGITELNEMAEGRTFVLEGKNMTAFLDKVRAIFVKMFENITKLFKKVIDAIGTMATNNKAWAKVNRNIIATGYEGDWGEIETYDLNALNDEYGEIKHPKQGETDHAAIAKRVSGLNITDSSNAAGEMVDKLNQKLFVKVTYSKSNAPALNDVMRIIDGNDDIKNLKTIYNGIKKLYNDRIKELDDMRKAAASKKAELPEMEEQEQRHLAATENWKFGLNLENQRFSVYMKARKERRNVAFNLAKAWAKAAPAVKKEKKNEPKAKNESSIFNFDII